jgi:hypothetical protein
MIEEPKPVAPNIVYAARMMKGVVARTGQGRSGRSDDSMGRWRRESYRRECPPTRSYFDPECPLRL